MIDVIIRDYDGDDLAKMKIVDVIDQTHYANFEVGKYYLYDNNYNDGRYDVLCYQGNYKWATLYEGVFVVYAEKVANK